MRMFVAPLGTETNTFAPLPVDRRAFERAFYAPPGQHPATPTLTTAPIVAARGKSGTYLRVRPHFLRPHFLFAQIPPSPTSPPAAARGRGGRAAAGEVP